MLVALPAHAQDQNGPGPFVGLECKCWTQPGEADPNSPDLEARIKDELLDPGHDTCALIGVRSPGLTFRTQVYDECPPTPDCATVAEQVARALWQMMPQCGNVDGRPGITASDLQRLQAHLLDPSVELECPLQVPKP